MLHNADYELSLAAEKDLHEIVRYTAKKWGGKQASDYAGFLKNGIAKLAKGEGAYKNIGELYPGLRTAHCKHNYIFCVVRPSAPALVVAILHERMDIIRRVQRRLKP